MLKKLVTLGLATALTLSLAACSGGDAKKPAEGDAAAEGGEAAAEGETYHWKFMHEENETEFQHLYAVEFTRLVEEKTDGRVTFDIYPVGQLGDGTNQVELLQNGGVEFAINNPGAAATIIPEGNVFSLHFLMPDTKEEVMKVLREGEGIKYLSELYEAQGIHVITWQPQGYNVWTADKPLNTIDAWKGLKIRTMAAPVITKSYENYGATPVAIPYMELYSALQLKMADAQVNPIANTNVMKFYEVQKVLTLGYPDCFVDSVCANKGFWETVPDDIKAIIEEAAIEAADYMVGVSDGKDAEALENMGKIMQVVELTEEETEAFRAVAEQHYNNYTDLVGENGVKLLDLIKKDIANLVDGAAADAPADDAAAEEAPAAE